MSSISKIINDKRKKTATKALRELAKRIETGQLRVKDQGLWNGVTPDLWIFRIELQENPVAVPAETLSED